MRQYHVVKLIIWPNAGWQLLVQAFSGTSHVIAERDQEWWLPGLLYDFRICWSSLMMTCDDHHCYGDESPSAGLGPLLTHQTG